MPNRKIKHIVAKLVGASTEETLDVYDVDAVHTADIANNLTTTNEGYVLDARQGKALNDSLTAQATFTPAAPSEWTGNWTSSYTTPLTAYRLLMMTAEYNGQVMSQQIYPPSMVSGKSVYLSYYDPTWNARVKFEFNSALTSCTVSQFNNFTKVRLFGIS